MPEIVATGEDETVAKMEAVGESEYETGLAEVLDVTDDDEEVELLDDGDRVDVLDTVTMLVAVAVIDTFQLRDGSTDTDENADWNAETDIEELLLPVTEMRGEAVCQLRVGVEDTERPTVADKRGDALTESDSVLVAVTDGVSGDVDVALGDDVIVSIGVIVIVAEVDEEIEGEDELEGVRIPEIDRVPWLDADGVIFDERVKEFTLVRVTVIIGLVV